MRYSIGNTFPKVARLRKRIDFQLLQNSKQKKVVSGFLLVWRENGLGIARLGITASKKIGCAVERNRIKRILREYFRQHRTDLPALDFNVVARRDSAQMTNSDLLKEIGKAFRFAGSPSC